MDPSGTPTGNSVPRGSLDKNRKHVLCILWFAQNILGSEIFSVVKIQQYLREKKNLFSRVGVGKKPLQKSLELNAVIFLEGRGSLQSFWALPLIPLITVSPESG